MQKTPKNKMITTDQEETKTTGQGKRQRGYYVPSIRRKVAADSMQEVEKQVKKITSENDN